MVHQYLSQIKVPTAGTTPGCYELKFEMLEFMGTNIKCIGCIHIIQTSNIVLKALTPDPKRSSLKEVGKVY